MKSLAPGLYLQFSIYKIDELQLAIHFGEWMFLRPDRFFSKFLRIETFGAQKSDIICFVIRT